MNASALSAFCQLESPVPRMMRQTALVLALLCIALPTHALAGNGNGHQSQSDSGSGGGNGNGNGNAYGHEKHDDNGDGGSEGGTMVLSPEGAAAASDQNRALEAVQDGAAVPLSEIAKRVRLRFAARIIDAHLITHGAELVYRLTILTDRGVSKTIDVDAKAGTAAGAN